MAGVIALANKQLAASHKGHTVGYLNPRLYAIGDAAGSSSATFAGSGDFRDIVQQTYGIYTLKNNTDEANPDGSTPSGDIGGSPTLAGWDMTNGFGTPRAAQFVADLIAAAGG